MRQVMRMMVSGILVVFGLCAGTCMADALEITTTDKVAVIGQNNIIAVDVSGASGPVTINCYTTAPGAQFDAGTRTMIWNPPASLKGTYKATFTAKDGTGTAVSKTINVSTVSTAKRALPTPIGYDLSVFGNYVTGADVGENMHAYDVHTGIEIPFSWKMRGDLIYKDNVLKNRYEVALQSKKIYIMNIITGKESLLINAQGDQRILGLTSRNLVYYNRRFIGAQYVDKLLLMNLDTGVIKELASGDIKYNFRTVKVSGDNVVWMEYGQYISPSSTYVYHIPTCTKYKLTDSVNVKHIDIYKNHVVAVESTGYMKTALFDYFIDPAMQKTLVGKKIGSDGELLYSVYLSGDAALYVRRKLSGNGFEKCAYFMSTGQTVTLGDSDSNDLSVFEKYCHGTLIENCNSETEITRLNTAPVVTGVIVSGEAPVIDNAVISAGFIITIDGRNFGFAQNTGDAVFFTGCNESAKIVSWTDDKIECIVPYNAVSGNLKVNVSDAGLSNDVYVKVMTAQPLAGDWNGDGIDEVGFYAPQKSTFFLNGGATFGYGAPGAGWLPIAGDWNGDNKDDVGLYDPKTSIFYLKDGGTFGYGVPGAGWLPIAGDWNGDNKDEVGLFDPKTSIFYLKGGTAFGYGAPGAGWLPIAGDWNGDNKDEVGLYDPKTSIFYLKGGTAFGYGAPGAGWLPIAGDWNGDKKSEVGLYARISAKYYLKDGMVFGYGTPGE